MSAKHAFKFKHFTTTTDIKVWCIEGNSIPLFPIATLLHQIPTDSTFYINLYSNIIIALQMLFLECFEHCRGVKPSTLFFYGIFRVQNSFCKLKELKSSFLSSSGRCSRAFSYRITNSFNGVWALKMYRKMMLAKNVLLIYKGTQLLRILYISFSQAFSF